MKKIRNFSNCQNHWKLLESDNEYDELWITFGICSVEYLLTGHTKQYTVIVHNYDVKLTEGLSPLVCKHVETFRNNFLALDLLASSTHVKFWDNICGPSAGTFHMSVIVYSKPQTKPNLGQTCLYLLKNKLHSFNAI